MNKLSRIAAALVIGAGMLTAVTLPTAAQAAVVKCNDPRTNQDMTVTLLGGPGTDTFYAHAGDVIDTQGGNDFVYSDFAGGSVVVCLGEGNDYFGPINQGSTPFGSFGVRGGAGQDVIIGGSGNDGLFGGPGGDILDGRTGSNTLNGAEDSDRCFNGPVFLNCEIIS